MKSLAKFAWKLTAEGRNRDQAKRALAQAGTSRGLTGDANSVGGTALLPLDAQLEAIPKSGATIDAMSGRPLAMMAAAGVGVPVTMLLMDPGQTGARATAETLDWPTELTMRDRRELWAAARLRTCQYVIAEAVRAPSGPLKGTITRDEATGEEVVELAGETDATCDIVFPDLDDVEAKDIIDGIVAAAATGTLPPELILRHLLIALGIRDVDSILEEMEDDDGNFLWPSTAAPANMGTTGGTDPATGDPAPGTGTPGQPTGGQPVAAAPVEGPLARMADADFGLFGGQNADSQLREETTVTGPPPPARPAAGRRPQARSRQARTAPTREATGRQGDADFGLDGSVAPRDQAAQDRTDQQQAAGEQPDSAFDPDFFTI